MKHSPGFLKLVEEARGRVKEIPPVEASERLAKNPKAVLIDIREDHEWEDGHVRGAVHLGRGILERDLETKYPDTKAELILYCGGGFRSALSADAVTRMGYSNVVSLAGGYKALVKEGWPIEGQA